MERTTTKVRKFKIAEPVGWLLVAAGAVSTGASMWKGVPVPEWAVIPWLAFSIFSVLFTVMTDRYARVQVLLPRILLMAIFVGLVSLLHWPPLGIGDPQTVGTYLAWTWRWIDLVLAAIGLFDRLPWEKKKP